ncbi:uncharacterized protein LOC134222871 [Armigeres subalbatus]|uniref:uncharacterized protein LOC134222871 n=1 Tax=Armigeres subalbatus TaxID=124917 RepID=UPI002ED5DA3E
MRLPNSVPIYEIVANFGTGVSDPPNVVGLESTSKDSLGTSSGTTLTAFSTECSQPSKTVEKLVRTVYKLKQRDLRKSKTIKLLRQNLARIKKVTGNKDDAAVEYEVEVDNK